MLGLAEGTTGSCDSVVQYSFIPLVVMKIKSQILESHFCLDVCQSDAKCLGSLPVEPLK